MKKQVFTEIQANGRLLKKKEAAERLRVSERTIDKYAEKGMIDKLKVPGSSATRFLESQINTLFAKPNIKAIKTKNLN